VCSSDLDVTEAEYQQAVRTQWSDAAGRSEAREP
jgi:hypothetical protein